MIADSRPTRARLLRPSTIAFIGLSDNSHFCRTIKLTFDGDAEIFMVNPRYDTVPGRPTVPSLTELGRPVDAVLSCMSVERTSELVEETAGLDVGGVVLNLTWTATRRCTTAIRSATSPRHDADRPVRPALRGRLIT
jgi:predicted CoA-binding protein